MRAWPIYPLGTSQRSPLPSLDYASGQATPPLLSGPRRRCIGAGWLLGVALMCSGLSWSVTRVDPAREAAVLLAHTLSLPASQVSIRHALIHPLGQLLLTGVSIRVRELGLKAETLSIHFDGLGTARRAPRWAELQGLRVTPPIGPAFEVEEALLLPRGAGRMRLLLHGARARSVPWLDGQDLVMSRASVDLRQQAPERFAASGVHMGRLGPVEVLMSFGGADGAPVHLRAIGKGGQLDGRLSREDLQADLRMEQMAVPFSLGSSMDLRRAQARGALSVRGRALLTPEEPIGARGMVTVSGEVSIDHLALSDRLLTAAPIHDLGVRIAGELTIGRDSERPFVLSTPRVSFHMGEAQLLLSGDVRFLAENEVPFYQADLRVMLPEMGCTDLLASMPRTLFPRLDSLLLKGRIGGGIRLALDSRNLPELSLLNTLDVGCQVVRDPNLADVHLLLDPRLFVERPREDGRPLRLPLGHLARGLPGSPRFQPLGELSWKIIRPFLVAEDNQFFVHHGFDEQMIGRALGLDLLDLTTTRGASTITQQLVKNLWLGHERALSRKLEEAVLAWRMEQIVKKKRILEVYLNLVELGSGIYGINMAAQHYFRVPATELTPEQAAQLAALLPAPRRGMDAAWSKRLHELRARMHTASVPGPDGPKARRAHKRHDLRLSLNADE